MFTDDAEALGDEEYEEEVIEEEEKEDDGIREEGEEEERGEEPEGKEWGAKAGMQNLFLKRVLKFFNR